MIGKTRQETPDVEEIFDAEVGRARGVLRRPLPAGKLRHARRAPAAELVFCIAHYWMIGWDLRGRDPHTAESLPHPNVHLVMGEGAPMVYGVQTQRFVRRLEGRSQVFGVKFRPGGFRPFADGPVSKLADRGVPATEILGPEVEELAATVLSDISDDEKIAAANAFFHERLPQPNRSIELADQLVRRILEEPEIKSVEDLAERSAIGKRSLQRIFNEYVGVSPKWVIRRYRLHELVETLNSGAEPDWAQLALELGYFDQAHMINDFRLVIGHSPNQYRNQVTQK
jgi:AraC-like DNA-binding protein